MRCKDHPDAIVAFTYAGSKLRASCYRCEKEINMKRFDEYQELAARTSPYRDAEFDGEAKGFDHPGTQRMLNALIGLTGEAGECADYMKKVLFHGHELDKVKMLRELGDVQWYCAEIASCLGFDLEHVAQVNIDKLKARYPEGFDVARSRDRATEE